MATTNTIQAIRSDIEGGGKSRVPFTTVERVLGQSYADDGDFVDAIDVLVAATAWITGYEIDWINRYILFTGPWTEPGGP
jgi:hypothetical protein